MGGSALKNISVQRIQRQDIPPTIQLVSQLSSIPVNDLNPLGSVGKTADSGDIDLSVDVTRYNPKSVHQQMCESLGEENCVYNHGTQVASYAVPIADNPRKGFVQVDLMFTTNPQWAAFTYHSPGEQSKYKGAVRTMLLMGVASAYQKSGIDYFEHDPTSGELIVRVGRTLDLNRGLRRIFQYRPKDKKGQRYLTRMKTLSIEEFKQTFPNIKVCGDDIIIDDPQEVLTTLFGEEVTPKDVSTAEQVLELIKTGFSREKQELIFKKAAERAKSFVGKGRLPPEIMEHV